MNRIDDSCSLESEKDFVVFRRVSCGSSCGGDMPCVVESAVYFASVLVLRISGPFGTTVP